ncbi:MAG: 4-alpha-glucanotransferase [Actinomycetota bacterium]|nr:4-alpha-glucanotransferase [Actinomycetota bacterium]
MQLHPTSLPSGRLGPDAYSFVDWLATAGQSWWQMLPLTPPDEHRSPYKSPSAFAASPHLLADPDARVEPSEERAFREREAFWVDEWASFAGDGAIADQVRFEREWTALRTYANERGVRLIGDIPIYVAPGSADHLAHPELFLDGLVAGAPPDQYSDLGQLWGNPMYDWPALRRRGYRWWIERMRRMTELFDISRIDHFRAFVAGWAVPEGAPDARQGTWRRGPGRAPFDAIRRALGDQLPLIAEDLGVITPPVDRLRDALGLPGMVVVQFGYDPADPDSPHRVDRHAEQRIAYASTHDSDTARGWYESAAPGTRALVDAERADRGIEDDDVAWALIRLTFSSRARVAMVQAQDVLSLGGEARMNFPGVEGGGSWTWKLEPGQLTGEHAARLRRASAAAARVRG